jgi:MFS family permease
VSPEAFVSWGWRIPFLASAVLLPVVMFIQLRVEDTPVFRQLQERHEHAPEARVAQAPITEVVRKHRRPVLLGAGLLFGTNAIFYISIAGVLDYATRDLGVDRDELLAVTLAASAISVFIIYFSGVVSDRVGRRPPILLGAAVIALWAFPFFWLIDTASLPLIFLALVGGLIGSSLTYGPLAAFLAELFEPRIRYSGASLAYQLAAILVSGGTPFLMTALLAATGTSASVSAYIFLMGAITFVSALVLRETRTRDEIRGGRGRGARRTEPTTGMAPGDRRPSG